MADQQLPVHIVGVKGLVFNDKDEILLVQHPQRGWEMPGGKVELGESLPEALKREVREEAGANIEVEKLVGVYSEVALNIHILTFRCQFVEGEFQLREKKILDVRWFTVETALAAIDFEPNHERLAAYVTHPEDIIYQAHVFDLVTGRNSILEKRII